MPSFKMKFSGVTILQGVEFSIFPIDFEWALQQCSATALAVIPSPVQTGSSNVEATIVECYKSNDFFENSRTLRFVRYCGDRISLGNRHFARDISVKAPDERFP